MHFMSILPLCIFPAQMIIFFSNAVKSSWDQLIYVESGIRQPLNALKHAKDYDFVLQLAIFFF